MTAKKNIGPRFSLAAKENVVVGEGFFATYARNFFSETVEQMTVARCLVFVEQR